jgi:hypothetical protein
MASNERKLRSADFVQPAGQDLIPEAVLDVNDPLHDIQRLAGLSDNNIGRLQEYKGEGTVQTNGSNMSVTAMEKINYQHQHNVQPGSPEWFRLWFSKPYLTGESPF